MSSGGADSILARLRDALPTVVPRFGREWEQYLLDWRPVIEDESGALRRKLTELRRALREELGLLRVSVGAERSHAGAPPAVRPRAEPAAAEPPAAANGSDWHREIWNEHLWLLYQRELFDPHSGRFLVDRFVDEALADFGGYDAVCLWQSYPRLGLDERNQFDYYRDLPGGIEELARVVRRLHERGVRAFLNYNPWDTGTRREPTSDAEALAALLRATGADGVFLDTLSSVDEAFVRELRTVRPDIAVCPELLPSLTELPALSGGWQQFALPIGPELVAHRWLDPDFRPRFVDRNARSHAEQVSIAFLHGTGHVVWENIFGWWNPWADADRLLLKRTTAILRDCRRFFRDPDWEPFVATGRPQLLANEWHCGDEVLYTLYNAGSEPCDAFALPESGHARLVDLWNGRELTRDARGRLSSYAIGAKEVGCIVASDHAQPLDLPTEAGDGRRHRPVTLAAYDARPVPPTHPAPAAAPKGSRRSRDMVSIAGGRYVMRVRRACNPVMEGGSYGDISRVNAQGVPDQYAWLADYSIDRTPVTKRQFAEFLRSTRYVPFDSARFLDDWTKPPEGERAPRHWRPPAGKEEHPVVWVSFDDARAYAAWAGLRLPTEAEWQRAAEGSPARPWPWGDSYDATRCAAGAGAAASVYAHPEGASRDGCLEMCGNVWEWTESERDDGHTRYVMVRGGCYLRVEGSIWYTASGAQPCDVHEKVLLLGGGIDRLSTVGFRCVRAD